MGRIAALVLAAACGPGPGAAPPPLVPATSADPPAHTPAPRGTPRTGGPAAAPLDGGAARASAVALATLDAIARIDRTALEALLADRVARVTTRPDVFAREDVLRALVDAGRQGRRAPPSAALDELIVRDAVRVEPLAERFDGEVPGDPLRLDDLVVEVPLTPEGRRVFGRLVRTWGREARLVVRRGGDGRVVGL